jgi:two-component system, cell cycle sensor histidine kinase and response regulator CckA
MAYLSFSGNVGGTDQTGDLDITSGIDATLAAGAVVCPCADGAGVEAAHTILLVEDDIFVRNATAAALHSCKYKVLTAASGTEGLEVCGDFPFAIDLLISDIVMPGVNGRQLAERFQELHPLGRVVLMSGYVEDSMRCAAALKCKSFLPKPFSVNTLLKTVSEILKARPNASTTGKT